MLAFSFRRLSYFVALSVLYISASLQESSSAEVRVERQGGNGRSILGGLGSALGGLLIKKGNAAPTQPPARKTTSPPDEDYDSAEEKAKKARKLKKKGKKEPNEGSPNALESTPSEKDERPTEEGSKPRKKIRKVIKKKKPAVAPPEEAKPKKLRPKYVDDIEELTETDKDWLTGLMGNAKAEQLQFEKELVAEILHNAKQGDAETTASHILAKKIQGYLAKLADTAREKGENLYDKTKQLFGELVSQAQKEGPEVMKKVKIYVSKILTSSGGDNPEDKGPLSDEDKAFLASLMAGVKWGDEADPATATNAPTGTGAVTEATTTVVAPTWAPYVPPPTSTFLPPPEYTPIGAAPTQPPVTPISRIAPASPSQSGGAFEQEALEAHNQLRAKHGSPPLSINPELTKFAQSWADNIASRGKMQHSTTDYGENIFFTGESALNGKVPVDKWYAEIADFDWNCLHCTFEKTGHFTQVIWAGTKEVGIGKASGARGTYVVANYNPAGNFEGQYPNNTMPAKF